MLVFKRVLFLVLIFSFLFAIGVYVYPHLIHDPKIPLLSFTSDPDISCNINGATFTRCREIDADGNVRVDFWLYQEGKEPPNPIVKIEAEAHGLGWAHIILYGNIDGVKFGDDTNSHSTKIGATLGFAPLFLAPDSEKIKYKDHGSFNTNPNEYSWDGSGSIKLVPTYWKWTLSGIFPGGSWEEAESDFHTTKSASNNGEWIVELDEYVIPSIAYNDTVFDVYESLEVTVSKSDLYYVMMLIDGILVDSKYASGGEAVLRKTWNTGDIGVRTVEIITYFGDEGEHSTSDSSSVTVE